MADRRIGIVPQHAHRTTATGAFHSIDENAAVFTIAHTCHMMPLVIMDGSRGKQVELEALRTSIRSGAVNLEAHEARIRDGDTIVSGIDEHGIVRLLDDDRLAVVIRGNLDPNRHGEGRGTCERHIIISAQAGVGAIELQRVVGGIARHPERIPHEPCIAIIAGAVIGKSAGRFIELPPCVKSLIEPEHTDDGGSCPTDGRIAIIAGRDG